MGGVLLINWSFCRYHPRIMRGLLFGGQPNTAADRWMPCMQNQCQYKNIFTNSWLESSHPFACCFVKNPDSLEAKKSVVIKDVLSDGDSETALEGDKNQKWVMPGCRGDTNICDRLSQGDKNQETDQACQIIRQLTVGRPLEINLLNTSADTDRLAGDRLSARPGNRKIGNIFCYPMSCMKKPAPETGAGFVRQGFQMAGGSLTECQLAGLAIPAEKVSAANAWLRRLAGT